LERLIREIVVDDVARWVFESQERTAFHVVVAEGENAPMRIQANGGAAVCVRLLAGRAANIPLRCFSLATRQWHTTLGQL
jgi:hypothetical protein